MGHGEGTRPIHDMRKAHLAFTCVYVVLCALTQLLVMFKNFYMATMLLSSNLFIGVVTGLYAAVLAAGTDHRRTTIGLRSARAIFFTTIVCSALLAVDIIRVVHLLRTGAAVVEVVEGSSSNTTAALDFASAEQALRVFLASNEWVVLVALLVWLLIVLLVNVVALIVYGYWMYQQPDRDGDTLVGATEVIVQSSSSLKTGGGRGRGVIPFAHNRQ